jgi:hypothetical protein
MFYFARALSPARVRQVNTQEACIPEKLKQALRKYLRKEITNQIAIEVS